MSGASIRTRGPKCQKLRPKIESGLKFLSKAQQPLSTRGSVERSKAPQWTSGFKVLHAAKTKDIIIVRSLKIGSLGPRNDRSSVDIDILGPETLSSVSTGTLDGVPVCSG